MSGKTHTFFKARVFAWLAWVSVFLGASSFLFGNSAPTDLNSTAPLTFPESQAAGSVIGHFQAIDPDIAATISYSLVNGPGSDDNGLFVLDANGTLKIANGFDFETHISSAFRRLPGIALNSNPGFEDGLTGWSLGGGENGTLTSVTDSNLIQSGNKGVDLNRVSGGYVRLTGSYVTLQPDRNYTFSLDFRSYGGSMYSGDQFELHRPGGVLHGNPVITDIGNNWKRLTRTMSVGSVTQYKISFAKYKSGHQYIDNGVVLDVSDDDGDGVPRPGQAQ